MITNNISSSDSSTTTTSSSISNAYALKTEDFIKLFLTELENQDPMEPVSTSEMTSQFSSITQVTQLETTNEYLEALSNNQAVNYLGKTISYSTESSDGTSTEKTSNVSGVVYKESVPYLVTEDGNEIELSSVTGVSQS